MTFSQAFQYVCILLDVHLRMVRNAFSLGRWVKVWVFFFPSFFSLLHFAFFFSFSFYFLFFWEVPGPHARGRGGGVVGVLEYCYLPLVVYLNHICADINSRFISKGPIHKQMTQLASISNENNGSGSRSGKRSRSHAHPNYIINLCCPQSWYELIFEPSKTSVKFKVTFLFHMTFCYYLLRL